MPNISDLNLTPEATPDVQWDAPEPGSFPPQMLPGVHEFRFALADDGGFDVVEIGGAKYVQVTYSATAEVEDHEGGKVEATLNFQRASTYQSPQMKAQGLNSMAGDLLRALGVKIEGPLTPQKLGDALNTANAQGRHFRAEVGWRKYCKADDISVSTHPRKKKGDVMWPRDAQKNPELVVACPKCGEKGFGNAEIMRFKLPENGASNVHSYTANGAQAGDTSFPPVTVGSLPGISH